MDKKEIIKNIIKELVMCPDGKHITEIYAKRGSIVNGEFTNWIGLMIETDPEFVNESLYDVIDNIEDRSYPFSLAISIEPDTVERGHGEIIYRKGDKV